MTWAGIAGGGDPAKRSKADFYPTPPDVTVALLKTGLVPKVADIWECACGDGRLLNVLTKRGYTAVGSDIQDGFDFLQQREMFFGTDWIITNPPFSLAEEFIEHAADLGVPFAFLLKANFWNAARRFPLFVDYPPSYVLPLTWRPDFLFGAGGGAPLMDCAWNVWLPDDRSTTFRPLPRPSKEDMG